MQQPSDAVKRFLAVASLVCGAIGCSSGSNSPVSSADSASAGTVAVTSTTQAPEDNVLKIGVLLPQSGPGTDIGKSALRAILTAQHLINTQGRVLGNEVKVFERNEGADVDTARAAVEELLDVGVDIIIGPASSNISLAVLPTIFVRGVAVCSPAATAIALDSFPDNGLLVRTAPSDSLQATAIAQQVAAVSKAKVSIAYVDDPYGRAFADALEQAFNALGIDARNAIGYNIDDADYTSAADQLLAPRPGTVVLIGDADAGVRMLAAIAAKTEDNPIPVYVNDTMRRPASVEPLLGISGLALRNLHGIAPMLTSTNPVFVQTLAAFDPSITSTVFAASAYDCVNIAALAAEKRRSTRGTDIVAEARAVTTGGTTCVSFKECFPLIRDNIDYNGPDGFLEIGQTGNRIGALFEEFVFDDKGASATPGPPFQVFGGSQR